RPGRKIFNSYGPTETTVVATVAELSPAASVTIGRPIANYTCYVVSEGLELLPPGTEGELLIGGPGVARGYLRREHLTREKFIKNPFFVDGPDPLLYRSGDAVEIGANGQILFRGRIDDQVKVRGFRVELGEIEAKLTELSGVARAAVVLRDDHGSDQLVAFVVPSFEGETDAKFLRGELRAVLPPYMIPARFEVAKSCPKLVSAKIDLKAQKQTKLALPGNVKRQKQPPPERKQRCSMRPSGFSHPRPFLSTPIFSPTLADIPCSRPDSSLRCVKRQLWRGSRCRMSTRRA